MATDGEALYSQQKQDQELTGLHYEFFIVKFRLKLKQVEKITITFRYDLNQIHYDYTVEVRNRFKGLDLIDRVPDELRMEVRDIVQETGIKTIPMEMEVCNTDKAQFSPGAPSPERRSLSIFAYARSLSI